MDRDQANRSIRTGLVAAAIAMLMFMLSFYAAVLYIGG
jgi:hypothetical protein